MTAISALAPVAILAASAVAGQAYAGWQNRMITSPDQIAGGNRALMGPRQMESYNAMKVAQAQANPINLNIYNEQGITSKVTTDKGAPPLGGNAGTNR